ncbi:hypothetical protein ACFORL_04580 [Legionella dresdenensis]|uniref:Coiled-coil protein n=1 Tax=Legionella dresdenensis TaxID=450200 RepID=A0ABV8CDF9_9GAMM
MPADSAKKTLEKYNHRQYERFLVSSDEELRLPKVSPAPGFSASKKLDVYTKIRPIHNSPHCVNFIRKNGEPHSFVWQTTAAQLKKGVRWGIIKPESITGKVIASLGQYHILAHERVAKGIISNTQSLKLKLVKLAQRRMEALEALESLANKSNTLEKYDKVFDNYIRSLEAISQNIDRQFAAENPAIINSAVKQQIRDDLQQDISRARSYLKALKDGQVSLKECNRSRGQHSIVEFVKQQMMQNLYELQGINQDLSFSRKRNFTLTRGELNDCIEDARKEIDDHRADPRNAVTRKHHGVFSKNDDDLVTYDFSHDNLTPARERQVLLGISFIEKWDKVVGNTVQSGNKEEALTPIKATRWQTHRNFKAFAKSVGYFLLNTLKSAFDNTRTWEEEAWSDSDFHLFAAKLRAYATPNAPMWKKPATFIKQFAFAIQDIFRGVRDAGAKLVISLPIEVLHDWASSKAPEDFNKVAETANKKISEIETTEQKYLDEIFSKIPDYSPPALSPAQSTLARTDYTLTAGEQNDILTSAVRGLTGFFSFFTHSYYGKDPVGGLLFTTGYLIGVGAIFMPGLTASLFGAGYVSWFNNFSFAMGSSKMGAAVAGGSTQAQIFASLSDLVNNGPSSATVSAVTQLAEDPLTYGSYLAAAYGLGYVLANGVAGYPIPWLSKTLSEDLGSAPETGYLFIGLKFALITYEALEEHTQKPYRVVKLSYDGKEIDLKDFHKSEHRQLAQKMALASWLTLNTAHLPKLDTHTLFAIEQQIDTLFTYKEAASLKKLLYPASARENSIAVQLFYIPLAYIPTIARVGLSLLLGVAALIMGRPHPARPIERAVNTLTEKTAKDISRAFVAASETAHFMFVLGSSNFKALAFTINMAIGRVAGLFDSRVAHAMHNGFAKVHISFRTLGEFLYPARMLKKVVDAHPAHTIIETERSYKKILKSLPQQKAEHDIEQVKQEQERLVVKYPAGDEPVLDVPKYNTEVTAAVGISL